MPNPLLTVLYIKWFEKMKSLDIASTKTQKMDIFKSVWLHGVHPTAECRAPRFTSYRRVKGTSFLKNSAVCITPRSQTPQSGSGVWVKLHAAKSENFFCLSLFAFQGTVREGWTNVSWKKDLKFRKWSRGVMHTAELITRRSLNFRICDRILWRQNRNRIQKYFRLSWVKIKSNSTVWLCGRVGRFWLLRKVKLCVVPQGAKWI